MAKTLADFEKEQATQGKDTETTTTQSATGQEAVTTTSTSTTQEVQEDVVVIGGKPRPLKNYEAELRRKHEEDLRKKDEEWQQKIASTQTTQTPTSQSQGNDFWARVEQMAQTEMATSGRTIPLETIAQVATSIANRNIEGVLKTRDQANNAIEEFMDEVENEPDFKDIRKEFKSLARQLKPEQINAQTLEICLNSVRGKKAKELMAQARAKGKEDAIKDTSIIGNPTTEQTATTKPGAVTLSSEQKVELARLQRDNDMEWTEDDYIKTIQKKQARFKAMGAKNVPLLISDEPIK
jgi:vacuolar-type H+-ATPase subunit I/STV1